MAIAASSIAASPSAAAIEGSSYVYCSNGIACVMQPCPSHSALDLATGEIIEVVSIDTTRLPWQDRAKKDLSASLDTGKIVVKGSIEHEPNSGSGYDRLIATSIERASKKTERKHCRPR
ncbi:DUF6748 domain-containing protein [Mesorhizobium waimense]|nr:DUF6748 domain-containing protein [Mesorhizobium waimense]